LPGIEVVGFEEREPSEHADHSTEHVFVFATAQVSFTR
jgi:hypothetical protein